MIAPTHANIIIVTVPSSVAHHASPSPPSRVPRVPKTRETPRPMIDARCSTPPHTRARAAPPRAMVDPPPPDPPRHARNRSLSAPLRIDLTGAAIEPSHHSRASSARAVSRTDAIAATTPGRDANTVPSRPHGVEAPAITLPRQRDAVRHFALDLGGSLVKLVYFRPDGGADGARGGRLHFKKFPSAHLDDCLEFIEFKGLHLGSSAVTRGDDAEAEADDEDARAVTVKATGGGAYKFSKVFLDRLGISIP
jgi:hypothetical protein